MTDDEMVDGIEELSARAADAIEDSTRQGHDVSAIPIEHCDGWTLHDLILHLARVQQFWVAILTGRVTERSSVPTLPSPPDHVSGVDWLRAQSQALVAALRAAPNDLHVWTWFAPEQNIAFVKRRQLVEVAIHGWDAQNAIARHTGTVITSVPSVVADVGLQEFVEVMSTDLRSDRPAPEPLDLGATDTAWHGTLFAEQDRTPELLLSDTSSGLLLTLWGRKRALDTRIQRCIEAVDLS